ncbi:MAG: hypothetical protein AAGC58_09530 [Asticcacaulis sp.]
MRRSLIGFGLLGLWPAVSVAEDLNHLAITGQWLKSASVSQVAARLLPEAVAADMVDSRIGYGLDYKYDPPSHVRLYARGESATSRVCRRTSYRVSLRSVAGLTPAQYGEQIVLEVGHISSSVQIGLSQGEVCTDLPSERFAYVQGRTLTEAIEALEWLASLQVLDALPEQVTVTCMNTSSLNASCPNEPFAVLKSLPLEKTYIIDEKGFAVMPQGPGQLYWDVRLEADGQKRRITLEWGSPAPF